jgi:surfactin synthase thioesterase subunit
VSTPVKPPTWLNRTPSPTVAGRVFCIPQAGCGTSVFDKWPNQQSSIEFLPVELPGRLSRFGERMPGTFQELALAMLTGLEPYLSAPFAFFGHCWSGLIAYEATVLAERSGRVPTRLFVSSDLPPQTRRTASMSALDEGELTTELANTIRALGKEPHPELMSIYVKILSEDIRLRQRSVASFPMRLATPITVLGWKDDTEIPPDRLDGWSEIGDAEFNVLPGDQNRCSDAPSEMLNIICADMAA